MHLLALCLICGIASMCFGVAWFADLRADVDVNYMRLNAHDRGFSRFADNVEDQFVKTKGALEATQKAVDELQDSAVSDLESLNERVHDLSSAFESHKGSLQAHKKLPRGRAR